VARSSGKTKQLVVVPRARAAEARTGQEAIPYLLRQVAERLGRSLNEALKPFDQTPSVYRVLIALARRNPARITELAELTLLELSTLSRTIDRMEHDGLVKRASGTDDARTVLVSITQAGRDFLDGILPAVSAQYEWSIHDVRPADVEVMRSVLKAMLRNLRVSPIK
jgi:DNA-binding MarR family transcriptional regulator